MKKNGIYTRILLILILTSGVLLLLFATLYYIKNKQEKFIIDESQKQFNKEVDSLIAFKAATINQVAYDYTFWDDFVKNMGTKDTAWFNGNITTIIKSYHFDYVGVYDTSFNIVHEASSTGFTEHEFIFKETLKKLKKAKFLHFFQELSDSVIEISGASIHPNNDPTHTLTKPSGYLFLAKRWNQSFLHDLKILSGSDIRLLKLTDSVAGCDEYSISSIHKLFGWDGKPVAQIIFNKTSNSFKLYHDLLLYMFLILFGSILTALLIFHYATRKWINKPLKLVTSLLESNNLTLIKELQRSPGEFENIGTLFSEFFNQKEELRHAKERAEESDRLKSAFLANMSHEIRTPMNGILGFAELLKEPNLTGEKQQNYIQIIEESGARMLNIINNIVDISKIESGLMKIDLKESNINEQIEYIYSFFRSEVEAKGMKLSIKNVLPPNQAVIITDREKLFAILINLVKNAIKYSKEGAIEIGYIKKGNFLEFYVKDTGIGIPANSQSAIFERFIQVDITNKMARQGAGLGLSITKAYVEMLGGKIWVNSEEGIGSTFYFTLPYNAKQEEKIVIQKDPDSSEEGKQIKNLKILIAEDDNVSELLIEITVNMFSNEILKVGTGVEAVEACRNNPDLDLVFMDIQMPKMDGYEATRQIRHFNKKVIIIAQTAYGLLGDREKAIESGCNDYISKPISKRELLTLLQKYFSR